MPVLLNNVICLLLSFDSFLPVTSGVLLFIDIWALSWCLYCSKSGWRVFLRRWRKIQICTILQPMVSNGRYRKKSTKSCWPIRSKETCIKFVHAANIIKPTQTLINREKYTFCVMDLAGEERPHWDHTPRDAMFLRIQFFFGLHPDGPVLLRRPPVLRE